MSTDLQPHTVGADALIARARDIAPSLATRAAQTEADRRVPQSTVDLFIAAGFFRALQPARFGGYELDYGTQTRIAAELAVGCPSSAWVYGVLASHSWMLGMFPAEAQADVWASDHNALLSTGFMAVSQQIEVIAEGVRISGRWKFSSGVDSCDWAFLMIQKAPFEGDSPEPHLALVPKTDIDVVDVWEAAGLAGTGTNDLVVSGAVVPIHRIVPVAALRGGPTPGSAVNSSHLYQLPLFAVFPFCTIGTALGAARGAFDTLLERSIDASNAAVKPPVPRSPASGLPRAAAIIDSVEASLSQLAARINAEARAGVVVSSREKLRGRLALGYAAEQLVDAMEIMLPLVGARGLAANDTVQRAWRDVHAVAQHVALAWDVQAGLFADVLFGHPCPDPKI